MENKTISKVNPKIEYLIQKGAVISLKSQKYLLNLTEIQILDLSFKLATSIAIQLLAKTERKIFDSLTKENQTCKEISLKVNMTTKNVSSTLLQMEKKNCLIFGETINSRRKSWRINSHV